MSMTLVRQIILWLMIYLAMVLVPIALVFIPPLPPARSFWYEFGIALGFIGLAMMGVQFALTARFRWIAGRIGMDSMLHFHRQTGIIGFCFVMAHPIVLIANNQRALEFFDPTVNFMRAVALITAIIALLLIVGLSLWRKTLRVPYEWWRLTHGVLSALVVLIGLAHTLMVGRYVSVLWKQGMWIILIAGAIFLLIQMRILKPLAASRRPWRIESVRKDIDRVWTLTLVPINHDGMSFRAGQCIWLSVGDSIWTLESHPFTIASSADAPKRIELTIKELGDWTRDVGTIKPGTRAFLEGPYGAFMLPKDGDDPLVLIAGGIGITPMLSMLRTMRDREDQRRVLLIYAANSQDRLAFHEELASMQNAMNLELILVLQEPPEHWEGERGLIDADMLARCCAPFESPTTRYYVCGPEPMMDAVEDALLHKGIALQRINSERFEIA
jgi:predicted ferric reductase